MDILVDGLWRNVIIDKLPVGGYVLGFDRRWQFVIQSEIDNEFTAVNVEQQTDPEFSQDTNEPMDIDGLYVKESNDVSQKLVIIHQLLGKGMISRTCTLRLNTSPAYPWLTTGWKLADPSYLSSQVYTDLGSSSGCCKYLPQVFVRLRFYLSILLIWFINIKFTQSQKKPPFFH